MYFKFHNILIVFLWSITCCYSQQVQTSVVNGLATTVFNTTEGKITIYIPNFTENESISGSIIIEPSGNSESKKEKNKTKLQSYTLDFGGLSTTLQTTYYNLAKFQPFPMELKLFDEKKNLISLSKIPLNLEKKPTSQSSFIPAYVVAGEPAKIVVSNNGSLVNSFISINNTDTKILAASETNVFFQTPSDLKGKVSFQYKNDATNIDDEVNILQLNLSAGKLNLSRAETTNLNIEVVGLEGLQEEVPLIITNKSPSNISLEGGNQQQIVIQPNGDSFQLQQTIRAIQGGGFSISAVITPDSQEEDNTQNSAPLCNCLVEDQSLLISPEACVELGGVCKTDIMPMLLSNRRTEQIGDHVGNFNFSVKLLLSYSGDIEDLEDDILEKWEKWDRAKHVRDSLNDLHYELVTIDAILDRVPDVYKDELKRAVDSLVKASGVVSDDISDKALDKAITDAQSSLEACEKRIAQIQEVLEQQEEELETLEAEMNKLLKDLNEVLDDYCLDNSCLATLTKNDDGTYKFDYKVPKGTDESTREYIAEFTSAIYKAKSKLRRALKNHKKTLETLEDAQNECSQLAQALQKAKEAKAKADYKAALELELEEQCEQLKRILSRLKNWCKNNPDHCDFLEDIEAQLEECPKTPEELDDFWNDFDALLNKKKALEDGLAKAANDAQKEMDDLEDDVTDLENDIAGIEEQKRKDAQAEQERKQKIAQAEAEEAAAAKAAADERKKKSNKQKKEDDKIKDLIKKAKSDDAGDDAFEDLITGLGLDRLDDVTGNLKLGKLIGGLLVIKDQPDCVCPLLSALLSAIKAKQDGGYIGLHVEAYIQAWNECANLSNIVASVSLGGTELTEAINGMTKNQVEKALAALNQAVRIQCK